MGQMQLTPDIISCNAALAACRRAGQWQSILKLLADMPLLQIAPDLLSLHSVLDCVEGTGHSHQEVFRVMGCRLKDLGKGKTSGHTFQGMLYAKALTTVQWWMSENLPPKTCRTALALLKQRGLGAEYQEGNQISLQIELRGQRFSSFIHATP
ncbi:unnamed protein product [Symbiodinium natans]|uniref:Pentatricopeptide repeat-containing protein n=1 Tax=Symbiodinium natans TaxID=878477 RepID=A0A812HIG9_9DINO|nr:unnamed protein product [Symbiodinium natans]